MERRKFLKMSATGLGAAAAVLPMGKALAATCGLTPPQTRGPFYPGEANIVPDSDLTQVAGAPRRALGQVVYIRGKVLDTNCAPIADANVEIWQACESGKYNHPRDPNPAAIDPHFKYWGETFTNANGEYLFKTIIPGAYPAAADWVRPPHIHFRIVKLGFRELVTQMYFAGNALNDQDAILQQLPAAERALVVIPFTAAPIGMEPGTLIGDFDITLARVR